jgi:hypothetical protein
LPKIYQPVAKTTFIFSWKAISYGSFIFFKKWYHISSYKNLDCKQSSLILLLFQKSSIVSFSSSSSQFHIKKVCLTLVFLSNWWIEIQGAHLSPLWWLHIAISLFLTRKCNACNDCRHNKLKTV